MKGIMHILVLAGILTGCSMTSKVSVSEPSPLQAKVDSLQTALDKEKSRSMHIEWEAEKCREAFLKYAKKTQEEIKCLKNDLDLCSREISHKK